MSICRKLVIHSLKVEAIEYEPLMNRDQMRQTVFEYIEVNYNRKRRRSALGYLSPEQYEKLNVVQGSVHFRWSGSVNPMYHYIDMNQVSGRECTLL